ncbi:alkane hydroxylase MAH1-like [Senna tora]|uniref:Alkane hydroxylase MAH1-like n=1 Tax=Senna tora TaxID=362788 RepID=A0A834X8D8_9FABA|nr:alkane hydroxylase MAH1-like [Senna tora]
MTTHQIMVVLSIKLRNSGTSIPFSVSRKTRKMELAGQEDEFEYGEVQNAVQVKKFRNFHFLLEIHDFVHRALRAQATTTANFRGPWFTSLNYLFTCNPINIQYILTKNFSNYEKGEFRQNFQVLGDGILAAESETWKYSRTLLHSLFKKKSFELFSHKILQNKILTCLLPVLDYVQTRGMEVDLQDVFQRFTFDYSCSFIFGYDPQSLSIHFPEVACAKAFTDTGETIMYRHAVPKSFWKLRERLQIGAEKKLATASKFFDEFLYERIKLKREELSKFNKNINIETDAQTDLLATLIKEEEGNEQVDDKFLRDTTFSLLAAGRETITVALTCLCWLVATHPSVEAKILQEIKEQIVEKGLNPSTLGVKDVKNLVYIHGAICEALRLFPPVPLNFKQAIKADILPSGDEVKPNTMLLLSFYSVGRLEEVWGEDCLEFKPERWISDTGCILNVPSYEFTCFSTGPRTCLGKNMSFIILKIMATAVMWNYHIQVVEGHPVYPAIAPVLLMKHGLKVKITKRG